MQDATCVYIDRLKNGETEYLEATLETAFLELPKEEVHCLEPVFFKGEAYIVSEYLVLQLQASLTVECPCAVCNESARCTIVVAPFLHEESLAAIKGGVFNFSDLLREAILLELPHFPKCGGEKCNNRSVVEPFLKTSEEQQEQKPFRDL